MAKEGFRVLPPLDLKEGFDLMDPHLFLAVLGLVRKRLIKIIWVAPPCTTFSLAQTPKLRSLERPWGFDWFEKHTARGNLHAVQALLLCWIQMCVGGFFAGEQPAWGFMRALPPRHMLLEKGAIQILFDWCQYGCDYKKTTRLLSNISFLVSLGRRCRHHFKHVKLEGTRTTLAGAYSKLFCEKFSALCRKHWKALNEAWQVEIPEVFSKPPTDLPRELPGAKHLGYSGDKIRVEEFQQAIQPSFNFPRRKHKRGSPLWAVQLSEGLTWKNWMQYKFKHVAHINLQECKARRSLVKRLPRDRRVVVCQDSRVNLGALGKGRSPSQALNNLLQTEAPYLLAKNLHVSGVHFPTWSLRADAPSRNRKPEPARAALPKWFWRLSGSDGPVARATMDALEQLPRAFGRWWLFCSVLLLRASSHRSTSTSNGQASGPCIARTRPCVQTHSCGAIGAAGKAGSLASQSSTSIHPGAVGALSPELFVRMVGGVHDPSLPAERISGQSGRNTERSCSTIWMAKREPCGPLGRDSHLGCAGACHTSPSHAGEGVTCSCRVCIGLGLVSVGDLHGISLFWIAETFRSHLTQASRPFPTRRTYAGRPVVHPNWPSEDSNAGSLPPTRESRRAGSGSLGSDGVGGHPIPYSYLARLFEIFSTAT